LDVAARASTLRAGAEDRIGTEVRELGLRATFAASPNLPLPMPTPQYLQLFEIEAAAQIGEAAAGLLAPMASVSPKFFYDALGSRLFDAITELPEYYLTRTEAAIFQAHGAKIAQRLHFAMPPGFTMIDLGAGNGAKAARLFEVLAPAHYVAVDISVAYLRQALQDMQLRHPSMTMTALGLDFSADLTLPDGLVQAPALVFYPGSSIGNFDPDQALALLRRARTASADGALLIGVDLVKDIAVLERAYDDPLGVTAAFNLNLLRHLNQLLGADFDVRDWRHLAYFNRSASRIEMHLQAKRALTVRWPGGERHFIADETIHTENSYKWKRADFENLLREAGYRQVRTWTDDAQGFAVALANC
jgi:L-histidine Nalpha-methyltransferase